MAEAPSLVSLCLDTIADELLLGDVEDDFTQALYEIPSELLDSLLPRLTPLALELLQRNIPFYGPLGDNAGNQRKRKRWLNFEMAWKMLYETRWPSRGTQSRSINWMAREAEVSDDELIDDWMQMYWEKHLQDCVDVAMEVVSLPSFSGSIGLIETPGHLLKYIGCYGHLRKLLLRYSKFSDHCQHFGSYARCLRLSSFICVPEICDLLRNTKLESIEINWIKSKKHVDGLCAILKQNCDTLKSVKLIHCKLSAAFINNLCYSLCLKDPTTHGIQHFSIKQSSFLQTNCLTIPIGLASFLFSARSLSSLSLSDVGLGKNFFKMVIDTLLDTSSNIASLDLSENFISGWLSHLKFSNSQQFSCRIDKSLQSLRVLNLRNANLEREDADCLKCALYHMPKLETLDLSDNPLEDGIMSMIPYFAEMSERPYSLVNLKLGNCNLTCNGASQLLETLSTWKKPLSSLSIRENDLGRKMGTLLGKFLCQGIQCLDIDDIGLEMFGFQEAQEEIMENLKLVYINISKNRGGHATAKFLSKLISCAHELVAIDARFNFMPVDSLSIMCSSLKGMKGKLEHLDLTGNPSFQLPEAASILAQLQNNGKCPIKLESPNTPAAPYDDDP